MGKKIFYILGTIASLIIIFFFLSFVYLGYEKKQQASVQQKEKATQDSIANRNKFVYDSTRQASLNEAAKTTTP